MRKLIAIVVTALTLFVGSGVASAEHGSVGGVGTTSICTAEHGTIGGIGTQESGVIYPWACGGTITPMEHGSVGGVGTK